MFVSRKKCLGCTSLIVLTVATILVCIEISNDQKPSDCDSPHSDKDDETDINDKDLYVPLANETDILSSIEEVKVVKKSGYIDIAAMIDEKDGQKQATRLKEINAWIFLIYDVEKKIDEKVKYWRDEKKKKFRDAALQSRVIRSEEEREHAAFIADRKMQVMMLEKKNKLTLSPELNQKLIDFREQSGWTMKDFKDYKDLNDLKLPWMLPPRPKTMDQDERNELAAWTTFVRDSFDVSYKALTKFIKMNRLSRTQAMVKDIDKKIEVWKGANMWLRMKVKNINDLGRKIGIDGLDENGIKEYNEFYTNTCDIISVLYTFAKTNKGFAVDEILKKVGDMNDALIENVWMRLKVAKKQK